ncbi:hypothetical protein HK099_000526 [Clydaea vesicula]|uniref:Regulatory particle non-ATPase 13 n=1 Tax=Clydaea vesicula TaxID=447962 RepID=A0AAD5U4G8_9FUNG|nr:hypothetical protein HK099_000526 [Clydaea vesicula]
MNLVEMKVGKCLFENKKVVAIPDSKGLIYLRQSEDDQLLHFYFKNRITNEVEDDKILFPFDAEFKELSSSLFLLKFKSSSEKNFFWLQETSTKQEIDRLTNEFKHVIENFGVEEDYDMTSPLSDVSSMNFPTPKIPDVVAPQVQTHQQANTQPELQNQLRNILATLGQGIDSSSQQQDIEFSEVLNSRVLLPLLDDPKVVEELLSYLPEGSPPTQEELKDIVRCPQFLSSMRSFGQALKSGQLGPLLREFGLPYNINSVRSFLKAVREQSKGQ